MYPSGLSRAGRAQWTPSRAFYTVFFFEIQAMLVKNPYKILNPGLRIEDKEREGG
jgi:hypothetical protein